MNWYDSSRLLSASFKRRDLLRGAGALTGVAIASQFPRQAIAQPRFSGYPFTLGVASGDPLADASYGRGLRLTHSTGVECQIITCLYDGKL
jgi:hypothetical protein